MIAKRLPYARVQPFLPEHEHSALVDFVLAQADQYRPATIRSGNDSVVNPSRRVALVSRDFGPLEQPLRQRFKEILPTLMDSLGASGPEPPIIELELAAHGDGAFYGAHTDLPIGAGRKRRDHEPDRILSAVYYFYAEPKGFRGGQLRLFDLGADDSFRDLEPEQNCLIAFHSWTRHEVRRVSCPSGAFEDYRFAINCWYRRDLQD
jgi:Rps23 Pro-64 3,4-dihydroxylase Tpa1-like proline 4-hydroxylase